MAKHKSLRDKSAKRARGVPARFIPEVAQAVIEDAMLSVAADMAAVIAESEPTTASVVVPENAIEREILSIVGVPFLGPTRLKALADVGIVTFEQLCSSSLDEIAAGRGIGRSNAVKIRDWLDNHKQPQSNSDVDSAEERRQSTTHEFAVENQQIQDDLGTIGEAFDAFALKFDESDLSSGLRKQIDRVQVLVGMLPEKMDTVQFKDHTELITVLDEISETLAAASAKSRLRANGQEKLRVRIKQMRKKLATILGE